jgi:phenylalanyl-tRNA synthetase alpha chain
MEKIDLKTIKKRAENEFKKAVDLKELDEIFKKYLGKKGEITQILKTLSKLPNERRAKIGKGINELKNFLEEKIEDKKSYFTKATEDKEEWLDITAPGKKPVVGHLHPLTLIKRRIEEIFQAMGFSVVEGPEVETEWYNFDALNIQKDHPARDFWDTLYLKGGNLLRTHTSPVQIRFMEKNEPPFRIIVPGRVFRHEATDAKHEVNFYQVEGLMVGKDVSVANFKAVIQEFLNRFYQKEIKLRLRPSFFPFTEPSFEIDINCIVCGGKGCSTCLGQGWIELMGAGMVHPNVLKNSGLDPRNWQGFAFGMGLDRLAMMKYKINDIRLFYSGDLRFLQQF